MSGEIVKQSDHFRASGEADRHQFNINSALNGILLSLALMFSVNIGQLAKHYAFAGSVFKDQWKTLFFDAAGDLLAAIAGGLILGIWR